MKLNNKGMTLMELLVSIALIGIVLVFLFGLLIDVKNETNNNNFAYNNQVHRLELIHTIESDLEDYVLLGIEDKSANNKYNINFYFNKGNIYKTAVLTSDTTTTTDDLGNEISKNYLKYTSVDGEKYSWEMEGATIDTCGLFNFYVDDTSSNYYFKLNIYLYNTVYHEGNNKDKNNAVDDIEISYSGNKEYLQTTNDNYLTNNIKGEKRIGVCTS